MTTGLRMKRRVVTTQEAAAEDDRSVGLQRGSVDVRGQMMNAHSKSSLRATWHVECATPSRHLLLYRWHHFFFLAGNSDSQVGFCCPEWCILGVYDTIILCSALLSIQNPPLANGTPLFHCWNMLSWFYPYYTFTKNKSEKKLAGGKRCSVFAFSQLFLESQQAGFIAAICKWQLRKVI